MNVLATGFVPYEDRNWSLCIDEYTDGEPAGRLYGGRDKTARRFCSALPLLHLMEELMDRDQTVQRFEEQRAFHPANSFRPPTDWRELPRRAGRLATFTVCVYFRQNATWQGEAVWLETHERACFRSALELLFLLDGALNSQRQDAKQCSDG